MSVKPINGSLLVAPPGMVDSRFSRTSLLVTHHNQNSSWALCINRMTPHNLESLAKEISISNANNLRFPLYWGGPVQKGSVWMLHTPEWENEHTMYVNEQWRVTSNESMFHCLSDGDAPQWFRICYGLCQWGPGQLETELAGKPPFVKSSSWLVANDTTPEQLFNQDPHELWEYSVKTAGRQSVDAWLA